jgi:hypothetical protein
MMQAGSTATSVSKKLNLPRQTVSGVFSRYKERGTVETTHQCGRPRKLDNHSLQQLNCELASNQKSKLGEIANLILDNVSSRTIQQQAHELGFHNQVAVEIPFVNSKQIEKRLKFASEHLSWTIDNWKKVVWSDESLFDVGKLSKQTKVWQKKGKKYNPECLQPTFKSGRTSTMVWGAFFNITKGPLVFLPPKQQTAKDFIENVYRPHLVPFLQNKDPEHQLIFMEDNTLVHTALASHNFRKEK